MNKSAYFAGFLFFGIFLVTCTGDTYTERLRSHLGVPLVPLRYPVVFSMIDRGYELQMLQAIAWWNIQLGKHWDGQYDPPIIVAYNRYRYDVPVVIVPDNGQVLNGVRYNGLARYRYTPGFPSFLINQRIELVDVIWSHSPCVLRHEIGHILGLAHDDDPTSVMSTPCITDSEVTAQDAEVIWRDYKRQQYWR